MAAADRSHSLHISGDDVRVVQIHRCSVFERLLLGFLLRRRHSAGVGSRRAVSLAALGATIDDVQGVPSARKEVIRRKVAKAIGEKYLRLILAMVCSRFSLRQ